MSTAIYLWSSQVALVVKNPRANAREINKERFIMQEINRTRVRSPIPGQEDPLEKGMATHPSILAWRIPWTEEPSVLQSTGFQRFRHDEVT